MTRSLLVAALIAALAPTPSRAHAREPIYINAEPGQVWPETVEAIRTLRALGVPMEGLSCLSTDTYCLTLRYEARDNTDAAGLYGGSPGNGEVFFNTRYATSSGWRLQLSLHELGHAAGLPHVDDCASPMQPAISMCGKFPTQYTPTERALLKELW